MYVGGELNGRPLLRGSTARAGERNVRKLKSKARMMVLASILKMKVVDYCGECSRGMDNEIEEVWCKWLLKKEAEDEDVEDTC